MILFPRTLAASGGYRNKAMGGGRLYWRGGIFQRRRNLFSKIINGGGGSPLTMGTGGFQSLTTGGGGTVLQSARNEVDVIW